MIDIRLLIAPFCISSIDWVVLFKARALSYDIVIVRVSHWMVLISSTKGVDSQNRIIDFPLSIVWEDLIC